MSNEPVKVTYRDIGIVDGLHTLEVINADTGELIGWDQGEPQPTD